LKASRFREGTVTPREADVTFALEAVPEVVGVYAVRGGPPALLRPGDVSFEFSVHLDPWSGRAAMHAAARLLGAMGREELARVDIRDAAAMSQPAYMSRATELHLAPHDREAARVRVQARLEACAREPALPPTSGMPAVWRKRRALLVEADAGDSESILRSLGVEVRALYDPRVPYRARLTSADALPWVRNGQVDVVLVDVHWAPSQHALLELWTAAEQFFGRDVRSRFFLTAWLGRARGGETELIEQMPTLFKPLQEHTLRDVMRVATRWLGPVAFVEADPFR
jgi:hypothetical protein